MTRDTSWESNPIPVQTKIKKIKSRLTSFVNTVLKKAKHLKIANKRSKNHNDALFTNTRSADN